MMRVKDIPYGGTIETGGHTLQFRKAVPADKKQLAKLYEQIAVTAGNYKVKLSKDSPLSFEKQGGMFVIMDEQRLEEEIMDPHSFWAVFAVDEEIAGCFWFADHNPLLPGGLGNEGSGMQGRTVFPREIIVSPKWKGRKLGMLLYATVFAAMYRAGAEESICDVYRVTGFQVDGQERQQASLLNQPSSRAILRVGGSCKGQGKEMVIALPGLKIWVEPQIYCINHSRALLLSNRIFQSKGIMIKEKTDGKNRA